MSKEHENTFRNLNYIEHFLFFVSAASYCLKISAFALLVSVPIGVTRFAEVRKNWSL